MVSKGNGRMSFSKASFCLVIVAALCQLSIAADHSNFKTCEQSGFCRRNRNLNVDTNKWTVVGNTIQTHATSLSFNIKNADKGLEYQATLTGLLDGQTFRFTVNDPSSIRKRFDASDLVLTPGLKLSPLTVRDGQEITVEVFDSVHKSKNKIVINKEPFRMDVYSGNDLVMVVNERNMFNFEKARAKDEADNSCTDGCWEETFKGSTDSKPHGPMSVGVDVTFVNFEHVYGVPAHADSLSLKNTKGTMDPYRLYNVDIFEYELESPMSLYGAYPLMLAHNTKPKTVGFFWLNPSETWIDVETSNSGGILGGIVGNAEASKQTHWISETGTADMFFLLGPSAFDVMAQNGDLFGKTQLPPIYSLGHHQCRWNYYSVDEVMDVDNKADIYEIPMDAIWLDIEYTDGRSKKYFTWDPIQFKEHEMMIRNLTSKGRRLIAIIDPHIKKESGYSVYDEATSLGYFTKDAKEDKDFDGWCWPGSSCWADFVDPAVRDWWADKFDPKVFPGFEGGIVDIWNDMNEPSVFSGPEITAPRDMRHTNGIEHRDIHNMYGYLMTMSTHKGLIKHRPNLRPFILTRSFFAGSQRSAAVWTGDNMCKWDHLKASIPMLLSHSVTGITFIGADIPGFFHDPESEEIVLRWYQAAVFYPFFRAHAHVDTKRREPWIFSKDTLDGIRNAIHVRYSYMPYIYQLFYENEKTGVAPMRPLWMEFPTDKNTLGVDQVFMMGSALLNAPILDKGVQNLDVYLPAGAHWLDLRTLTIHEGGKNIQIPVDHNSIPIFQRAGTIVPRRIRYRRALALSVEDPISLDIFADAAGQAAGDLYLDDGHSFNYRNSNKFIKGTFTLKDKRFTYAFTEGSKDANSAWLERVTIYNFPSKPNKIQSGDGKQQIGFKYDSNSKVLVVRKVGCTFGAECSFKIL